DVHLEVPTDLVWRPLVQEQQPQTLHVARRWVFGRLRQPPVELVATGIGDRVQLRAASVTPVDGTGHEAGLLHPAQLGVDLAVRGIPEPAGRLAELLGESVARRRFGREEAEQRVAQGRQLAPSGASPIISLASVGVAGSRLSSRMTRTRR